MGMCTHIVQESWESYDGASLISLWLDRTGDRCPGVFWPQLIWETGLHWMARRRGMMVGLAGGLDRLLIRLFLLSMVGEACTVNLCWKSVWGKTNRYVCVRIFPSSNSYELQGYMGSPGGSVVENLPANAGNSRFDLWVAKIPWTEEPGGLQSTGSQRSWTLATRQQGYVVKTGNTANIL